MPKSVFPDLASPFGSTPVGSWQYGGLSLPTPALTASPGLSGSPIIGQTLTVAAGSWTDAASVQRDLLDGSTVIASGIADGYTHTAVYGESLRVREIATHAEGGTSTAYSSTLDVVYAAPAATGALADINDTLDNAPWTIDAGADFAATAAHDPSPTYSIVAGFGAGVSINASTGVVSIFGAIGEVTDYTIIVRETNADGATDDTAFQVTLAAGATATTLSLDDVPFDGIVYDTGSAAGANMQHRVRNNANGTVTTDKVWGVDAAPTGVTVVNSAVTIDSDTFVGAFTGWQIDGLSLHVTGGWSTLTSISDVLITVAEDDLPLTSPQPHYVFVELTAPTVVAIADVKVVGPNVYAAQNDSAGFAAPSNAFRVGGPGDGTGYADTGSTIQRLHCFGVVADGLKIFAKGSVIEDCSFEWEANTPEGTALYDDTQTYNINDYVLNASDHLFRALVDGITGSGNTPPTSKVSDANWESLDPHMDGITVFASEGGNTFARNLISMRTADGRVLVGANNGIRAVADDTANPLLSDTYQNNVIDRDRDVSSRSIQHDRNGATNVSPSAFIDNWCSEHSGGQLLYIPDADFMPIWVGNRNLDTGAVQNDHPTLTTVDRLSEFNSAAIPVTGTTDASDGDVIEARVVLASDGTEVHTWADLDTVASGAFSGEVAAEVNTAALRVEARVKLAPSVEDEFTSGFYAGHVVAQIQQSEDARMYLPSFSNVTTPTITDEDALVVVTSDEQTDAAVTTVVKVNNTTPLTAAMASLSNELAAIAPGEKFMLIDLAHSGTNRADLVNDADTDRSWANMVNTLSTAGTHPGLVIDTWTAADGAAGDKFRGAFYPVYSKLEDDGTPFVLGSTHTYSTWTPFDIDHCLWDLDTGTEGQFDADKTKLMFYGPHRFEPSEDLLNAVTSTDSSPYTLTEKKGEVRTDIRTMVDDGLLSPIMTHLGPELNAYENGHDDGAGGWTDYAHPSDVTNDGLTLRGAMTAHVILSGLGRSPHIPPQINRRYEDPDGLYVEFWYEAPDGTAPAITTTRIARSEASIGTTYTHWTDVAGFEIDGAPAENVSIVSGRIRVEPNSGTLSFANTITFGEGGASGQVKFPEDMINGFWKNYPIVAPSAGSIDGIALRPVPDADVMTLTRVPVVANTFNTSPGTYFVSDADVGVAASQMTMKIDYESLVAANGIIAEYEGFNYFGFIINSDGSYEYDLRDADGTTHFNNVASSGTPITFGAPGSIVVSADMAAGTFKVWIDGTLDTDVTFTPGTGSLPSNRTFAFCGQTTGADQMSGIFNSLTLWLDAVTTDGSDPVTTPFEEISGDAATVNAHAWKAGVDAT